MFFSLLSFSFWFLNLNAIISDWKNVYRQVRLDADLQSGHLKIKTNSHDRLDVNFFHSDVRQSFFLMLFRLSRLSLKVYDYVFILYMSDLLSLLRSYIIG